MTAAALLPAQRQSPLDVARALHARFRIEARSEIEVELIAWHCGARVLWRHAGAADARVVLSGSRAILGIAAHARGTPRARFSIAHELGHVLMHRDFDAIARIHGGAVGGPRDHLIEREADVFASELLLPERLARILCMGIMSPTLDHVAELARDFRVSLTVAAKQWPKWTAAPCAFFEASAKGDGGVLRRVVRSEAFRGIAVERRALREGTLALEMLRARGGAPAYGARTHEQWWGSGVIGEAVVEECVTVADGVVVGWLRHG
jgi:uncharacterized protein DUF955